jgi:ComF family protein
MALVSTLTRYTLNTLLPPRCAGCGVVVQEPHSLCGVCFSEITHVQTPWCYKCGKPHLYQEAGTGQCDCLKDPYSVARSAIVYDEHSKQLILKFKHLDKTSLSHLFAKWLLMVGDDVLVGVDYLVSVPLHWTRQIKRQYNQAALLARHVSQATNIPVLKDVLVRIRPSLDRRVNNAKARYENRHGAFKIQNSTNLGGKTLVIIDDVWTTGKTVTEIAHVLKKAGAGEIRILTLARTFGHDGGND